jgi:hypothetical protein
VQVLRALQKAVKPTMDSWQLPSSVALNDFGASAEISKSRSVLLGKVDGWKMVIKKNWMILRYSEKNN